MALQVLQVAPEPFRGAATGLVTGVEDSQWADPHPRIEPKLLDDVLADVGSAHNGGGPEFASPQTQPAQPQPNRHPAARQRAEGDDSPQQQQLPGIPGSALEANSAAITSRIAVTQQANALESSATNVEDRHERYRVQSAGGGHEAGQRKQDHQKLSADHRNAQPEVGKP